MFDLFTKQLLKPKPGLIGYFYALRKTFLTKFKQTHYSQFGEDVVLTDWIPTKNDGIYVDVGCYHPKKFSNTYALYKRGWKGINIDLHQLKINVFNLARPGDYNVVAAVSDQETEMTIYTDGIYSLGTTLNKSLAGAMDNTQPIKTQTLNRILEHSPYKNQEIDLLSIDAEGHDLEVLRSINLQYYKPKIILIETHGNRIEYVINSEIFKYLTQQSYYLANWVGYTLFFISPDCNFLKKQVS